jgi:WD40 repeat protein
MGFGYASSACFSADAKSMAIVLADSEKRERVIKVLSVQKGKKGKPPQVDSETPLAEFKCPHTSDVCDIHMGNQLVLTLTNGADTSCHVLTTKGKLLNSVKTNQIRNHELAMSPDTSYFAIAAHMATVKVWSVGIGEEQLDGKEPKLAFNLKGHKRGISSLCFAPDSKTMVTASVDGTWKLWDLEVNWLKLQEEPILLQTTTIDAEDANKVGLIRIGRVGTDQGAKTRGLVVALAVASDIYFYEALSGTLLDKIQGAHRGIIQGMAFHPNGESLASTGADKTIRIWKTPDFGAN